ncbi:hypothetical protein GGF37_003109, partial [Kickxella alabastrina]
MAGIISRLCHSIDVAPMMTECPTIATMSVRLITANTESVDAKDVVYNVLVPLLRQMESMYLNSLELAFYSIGDSDEALSKVATIGTRLGQWINTTALVLFSVIQVVVAQQGMWTDDSVLMFDYMCGLGVNLMKSLGIWSSAVNMGVDAVVVLYYVVIGEGDDAHCRACRKLAQLLQEHNIRMEDISSEHLWFSAGSRHRWGFPLGLRNMRLRSLLPMIQMMLGVLVYSLLVAGLEMQSLEITRHLLYLLRILSHELLPVLCRVVMRVLAIINAYTLCHSNTFGLLCMCAKYLHWEPMSAADLTGAEMLALAGNDKGVAGFGDVWQVVNHSGPRGTAIGCKFTEVLKPVPAVDILFYYLRIKSLIEPTRPL